MTTPRTPLGSVVNAERIIVYAFILLLVPGQIAAATDTVDGFSFGFIWSVGANALIGCVLFARLSYPDGDLATNPDLTPEQWRRRKAIYRSFFIDLTVVVLGQLIIFNIITVIGSTTFPSFTPEVWGTLYAVTIAGVLIGLGFVGMLFGALVISPIVRSFGPRADPRGRTMGIAFAVFLLCVIGMGVAEGFGSTGASGYTPRGLALYQMALFLTGIPNAGVTITSPALAWVARILFVPMLVSGAAAVHASRAVFSARSSAQATTP